MEKYCAGGGLDITAAEILGKGKRASDLFNAMAEGNTKALVAISEAITALGNTVVAAVNLLSPDCVLFSGGISEREEFLQPLITYIREKCYIGASFPKLEKAKLGEFSPLIGAALSYTLHTSSNGYPQKKEQSTPTAKKAPILSASIMCADILSLGSSLKELEASGIEYIHCDIMDNHFVPNLMLPPELLSKMRDITDLPFDFHLMTEKPETVIPMLRLREGDTVSVHYESTPHLQRVISMIKEAGARAAVAVNPATPVEMLNEIIGEIDTVLIMTVNPGFAGQILWTGALDKISRMKRLLTERELHNVLIEVDGNCSFENIPKMIASGADIAVVGSSSVFCGKYTVSEAVKMIRKSVQNI